MTKLLFGVLLALSIQAIYTGYNTLCLSEYGTRAFLNGEPQATAYICSNYDYTPYFPASMRETVSNLSR